MRCKTRICTKAGLTHLPIVVLISIQVVTGCSPEAHRIDAVIEIASTAPAPANPSSTHVSTGVADFFLVRMVDRSGSARNLLGLLEPCRDFDSPELFQTKTLERGRFSVVTCGGLGGAYRGRRRH